MKEKLIFWSIYVAFYYMLWAIVGLPFSLILFIILIAVFFIIYKGKNSFYFRFAGYIGIMISLFSDGTNDAQTSAVFSRIFILILGFLGMAIEYIYQLGKSDVSEKKAEKSFQVILSKCPKCFKDVPRFATKCPNCTADL